MRKLGGQFSRKLPRSKTPLPIPALEARRVHAGLTTQSQHILQRDQGKLGRRGLHRPDERPMNPIVAAAEKGLRAAALMLGGSGVEPTQRHVIVVRSRINDLASRAMWQIHARARIAKAELHHGHYWHLQPFALR